MRAAHLIPLALIATALSGCRFKALESFTTATTPNPPATWKGDRYAAGGVGAANGGIQYQTHYGEGSDPNSKAPVNAAYDQAAKGTGQHPGEYPNTASAGMGQTNSPAMQPTPESVRMGSSAAHG